MFAGLAGNAALTQEIDVAEGIWQAANDESDRRHLATGADAVALAAARQRL